MVASYLTESIFDASSANAQFVAILLGAFLASAGGFLVTWLIDRLERKRQERSIALVCLDLLTSLSVMMHMAQTSRGRGDPYGVFTMRLIRGCLRDLDVYERNRERIVDIADPNTRAEIYQCMTRLTLTLDGILSETENIAKLDEALGDLRAAPDQTKALDLSKQREERALRRDSSFDFAVETVETVAEPLAVKLRTIARADAQTLREVLARQTTAAQASVSAVPSAAKAPAAD